MPRYNTFFLLEQLLTLCLWVTLWPSLKTREDEEETNLPFHWKGQTSPVFSNFFLWPQICLRISINHPEKPRIWFCLFKVWNQDSFFPRRKVAPRGVFNWILSHGLRHKLNEWRHFNLCYRIVLIVNFFWKDNISDEEDLININI